MYKGNGVLGLNQLQVVESKHMLYHPSHVWIIVLSVVTFIIDTHDNCQGISPFPKSFILKNLCELMKDPGDSENQYMLVNQV